MTEEVKRENDSGIIKDRPIEDEVDVSVIVPAHNEEKYVKRCILSIREAADAFEGKVSGSLTWCHCTAGYNKKLFEAVFETPVEVEVVHSIRQGFDECLLKISFK